MKYLLVLAVVLVAFWIWRHNRQAERSERAQQAAQARRPAAPATPGQPAAMLACGHCGLHLPAADAVKGRSGSYCSQEHRRLAEG